MSIVFMPVADGGQDCMVNHGRKTFLRRPITCF